MNKWAVIKLEPFYPSAYTFETEEEAMAFYNEHKSDYIDSLDCGIILTEIKNSTGKVSTIIW